MARPLMDLARPEPATDGGPDPIVSDQLWRLGADPDSLTRTAATWRDLGRGTSAMGGHVDAAARGLLAQWQGDCANAYRTHQTQTIDAFSAVSTVASSIAAAMDHAAVVVRTAQGQLDDAWWRLRRSVAAVRHVGSRVVFSPAGDTQARVVRAAIDEANDIRAYADARLASLAAEMDGLRSQLWPHAGVAETKEAEAAPWLTSPELAGAGQVIVDGDRAIINATGGDDDIRVAVDPRSGERLVTIGGVVHRLPAGTGLTVRAGAGNDTITVAPGSSIRLTLLAGSGNDRVRGGDGDETILGQWGRDTIASGGGTDTIVGGAGADYLDGQGGDDILDGGLGDDTLYGLDGRDMLWGGLDRDYLDGGAGQDVLAGGWAADVLVGGRGGDTLLGGDGEDVLYSGEGVDRVHGGAGADRAFTQPDDVRSGVDCDVTVELTDVGGFIRVEGTPEFVARVQSDLDGLRSSQRGAQMLAALEHSHVESRSSAADLPLIGGLFNQGNTLVIQETDAANGYAGSSTGRGGAVDARIDYNPAFDDLPHSPPAPPVVVLYHELAHVYDRFYDTSTGGTYVGGDNPGVPNLEREAVGLPIDHDRDPRTPDRLYPDHPFNLTENGLRSELGLRPRTRY